MEWTPKWIKLPIIDFVRKVYEFKDNPDEGWNWIMDFANALMLGKSDCSCELAERVIRESQDFVAKKSEAGRMGGLASAASRKAANMAQGHAAHILPTPANVYDFAVEEGLDECDARDWFDMTIVERGGLDRNGNPIENWKGAIKRFCKNRAAKRSKGEVK